MITKIDKKYKYTIGNKNIVVQSVKAILKNVKIYGKTML